MGNDLQQQWLTQEATYTCHTNVQQRNVVLIVK